MLTSKWWRCVSLPVTSHFTRRITLNNHIIRKDVVTPTRERRAYSRYVKIGLDLTTARLMLSGNAVYYIACLPIRHQIFWKNELLFDMWIFHGCARSSSTSVSVDRYNLPVIKPLGVYCTS